MNWRTIAAATTREGLDELEQALWDAGAVSVTVEDGGDAPLFEPGPGEIPLWDQIVVTGLFEETEDLLGIRTVLESKGFAALFVDEVQDRVWEREWLSQFRPMCFGDRLWVCPAGEEPPEADAVVMHLDPGLAFGTGTHATTRLCLQWLDQRFGSGPVLSGDPTPGESTPGESTPGESTPGESTPGESTPGISVIDFGCGSGILGIAALLLGAHEAVGVDNDPQAIVASRENAIKNGVLENFSLFMAGEMPQRQFDLVLANILAQPLIDLASQLQSYMRPGADLVLSGIMESQVEWVIAAYPDVRFDVEVSDGWARLAGKFV